MKKSNILGIIGVGMVGGTLSKYFKSQKISLALYDKPKKIGSIGEINRADIIFLCLPTEYNRKDGSDLKEILNVLDQIKGKKIIVIRSTVVPGTTRKLQKAYPNHAFLFSPEFLTEKTADKDTRKPARQIVGYTEKSKKYADLVMKILPKAPFSKTMFSSEAEMVKYFSNCFYAIKVVFANQIYDLCQKLKINYETVRESAESDPMIAASHLVVFHKNYRGYGGRCLPKDVKALLNRSKKAGVNLTLLKEAEKANNRLRKKNSKRKRP